MILEDDQNIFPAAGNPAFVTDQATVEEAGEDLQATIETVQEGLTEEVMQELERPSRHRPRGGDRGRHAVPAGEGRGYIE